MSRRLVVAGLSTPVGAGHLGRDTQVVAVSPTRLTVDAVTEPINGQRADCTVVVLGPGVADPFTVVQALRSGRTHLSVIVVGDSPKTGLDPLGLMTGRHVTRMGLDRLDDLGALVAERFTDLEKEQHDRAVRAAAQAQLATAGPGVQRHVGERLFGEMLARAPIGVVLADVGGRILAWNDRAGHLLDLHEPDRLGLDVTQLFGQPDDVASHLGLRSSQGPYDYAAIDPPAGAHDGTFSYTAPDDSVRHLRLTGQRVTDDAGRARLLVITEDVTETVGHQRQLMRHSRQNLAAAEVAAAITATGSLHEALRRCSGVITAQLGFAATGIWTHSPATRAFVLQAVSGPATDVLGDHHTVAPGEGPVGRVGADRNPLIMTGSMRRSTAQGGQAYSFAGYPLISGDHLVGVLAVLDPGPLDPATLAPLAAIGRQIAVSIRQSQLYHQTVTIAEALQKPLLPPELPTITGLDLAARYQAYGDGTRIGGDFYDVFELADGRYAFVLGDVCGKGPEAAAVTGLVRHTIWTAAQHQPEPDYVLPLVNRALLRNSDARFCTLAYGVLDRADEAGATIHLTCAGHPPPVISEGGRARLSRARGLLLGAAPRLTWQSETVRLSAGDALVCYTDGFTEGGGSRGQRQPADIAAEVDAITSVSASVSASVIADTLVTRTMTRLGRKIRDDLATLVIAVPAQQHR